MHEQDALENQQDSIDSAQAESATTVASTDAESTALNDARWAAAFAALNLSRLNFQIKGKTGTLQLDGPISMKLIAEIERLCEWLEDEKPCTRLVIRGDEATFTRGIDLREFDLGKVLDIHGFHQWEKVIQALEKLPMLTVAFVRGRCVGAGLHLSLAVDVRVGVEGSTFGLDEVSRGFLPGMATWRLAKFVGLGRARELSTTGRLLDLETAAQLGLVDHRVACEGAAVWLERWLDSLEPLHPEVVALNRRLLGECFAVQYEEAIGNFLAAQHRAISGPGFKAAVKEAKAKGHDAAGGAG